MTVDLSALGATSAPRRHRWDASDAILYALGVGAGVDDLALTTENSIGVTQRALPLMAVVVGGSDPDLIYRVDAFDPAFIVHGAQELDLHAPFPVEGEVASTSRIAAIYDKGSGAVVEVATESVDAATGSPMFTTRATAFVRGAGGFGGDRGPTRRTEVPDRDPDVVVEQPTRPDQALLYRLSGDRNPLHSDPTFAARAGFDRPILHGLCTYGFALRGLIDAVLDGDGRRLTATAVRFSATVLPGETLRTEAWNGDGEVVFRTRRADGTVALDGGRMAFTP
ncbi:MAG TPA: MaoC/PaaZ C-terminal domain-containing protein [Acidimicrobiales bacterium]|nr:MaoC/PaaZ C-terminal domain-containing protein [Acidimicrobiales bacterium]